MNETDWQKANARADARREFREWVDSVAKAAQERERVLRVLGSPRYANPNRCDPNHQQSEDH
jgi:hypothetical protein